MVVEPLSEQLINAGVALTEELDRIGLRPQGALWLHAHHLNDWRFTVISDLVDHMGRRRVYSLIDEALSKIGPSETLNIADIHLAAPSEVLAQVLGGAFHVNSGTAFLTNCTVNNQLVDAVVYRLAPRRSASDAKKAASLFERTVAKGEFASA